MIDLSDSNYHDIDWNEFLKRISSEYKDYNDNLKFVNIAKKISQLKYFDNFIHKEMSLDDTIEESKKILNDIDYRYLDFFDKMLTESEDGEPLIWFFDSPTGTGEESMTVGHQLFLYITNTIFDISSLLHELTHVLINRYESYSSDKVNNEIAPILMEFIIASKTNDYSYLIDRMNRVIFDAKSILFKNAILNGEYELDSIAKKYNISGSDIDKLKKEILVTKKLSYDDEISYINGFIYAFYYSSLCIGVSTNDNYVKIVELLSFERNIELPKLDYNEIIDFLIDDMGMYVERQKYLCKK